MKKVKPAKLLGAIVLLFLFVVIGYGVTKALVRPGPRQLEQMERDKILEDPEVKAILAWEASGRELREQVKLLPPFQPPDDGIVTPTDAIYGINRIGSMHGDPNYDSRGTRTENAPVFRTVVTATWFYFPCVYFPLLRGQTYLHGILPCLLPCVRDAS